MTKETRIWERRELKQRDNAGKRFDARGPSEKDETGRMRRTLADRKAQAIIVEMKGRSEGASGRTDGASGAGRWMLSSRTGSRYHKKKSETTRAEALRIRWYPME
jgi:hypothetical protein